MSSNETHDPYDLQSSLLPSTPYTLAYCLPLFLVSLVLTLAGAFLIHDRTRCFKQRSHAFDDTERPSKLLTSPSSFLHGGLGGIFIGYAFGVHFSTFLALAIPSTTSSAQLSPNVFLVIWIIGAVICMPLGGRWKYAAMFMAAMSGFSSLALGFAVIVHPILTVRIVFTAVLVTLGVVGCLLPFPRFSLIVLRVACCATGVLGLVIPIALLSHNQGWGNVWERLWTSDGISWGDSREKGLSAGFCLFFLAGLVSDTFLHKKIGENPDEKWDRFLENYTTTLPNDKRRAGTFAPSVSLWDRLLGRDIAFAPVVDDTVLDMDRKGPVPAFSPTLTTSQTASTVTFTTDQKQGFLRKKHPSSSQGTKSASSRRAIKFRPLNEDGWSSDSDSDGDIENGKGGKGNAHAVSLSHASSTTLTPSKSSDLRPPSFPRDIPEYSDGEDAAARIQRPNSSATARPGSPWKPAFIRQQSLRTQTPPRPNSSSPQPNSPSPRVPSPRRAQTADPVAGVAGVVPATPSLLNAIARINSAQEAAYQPAATSIPKSQPGEDEQWDAFWTDVRARAST